VLGEVGGGGGGGGGGGLQLLVFRVKRVRVGRTHLSNVTFHKHTLAQSHSKATKAFTVWEPGCLLQFVQ